MRTAVFTIASKNYFAFVKTLMESLEETNPDYERFVVLADRLTDINNKFNGNYSIIQIDNLHIPEQPKMLFRYTILELNTAIKPFACLYLSEVGFDRIIYLDPDILVYKKMEEVDQLLDRGAEIILTPHLTGICNDSYMPSDVSIMQSGTYNLGFIALAITQNTTRFIKWWADKLLFLCISDLKNGLFVDQKWIDIVPGIFDNVHILRDSTYNTAYWNLSHRKITKNCTGVFLCNDKPLTFFHFSGMNPYDYKNISRYQNRYTLDDIGAARELFDNYSQKVLNYGHAEYQKLTYSFNYFEDGSYISELFRLFYRENAWFSNECKENPFSAKSVFYKHKDTIIPWLMKRMWEEHLEIQNVFDSCNSRKYAKWFVKETQTYYHLPKEFLTDLKYSHIKRYMRGKRLKKQGIYTLKSIGRMLPYGIKESLKNMYYQLRKLRR